MDKQSNAPLQVFVRRDADGHICSVGLSQDDAHAEAMPAGSPELAPFASVMGGGPADSALAESDAELSRVLEDLIDVLIGKGVMAITDLPEAAQRKLYRRRKLRRALGDDFLDDDQGLI